VPPDGADADTLTRTAMQAVASLAKANRTPVGVPNISAQPKRSNGDDGGVSPLLTFGLPVALIALAAAAAALRGRRREDDDEQDDPPDGE
jgi:hypothetical protein